MNGPAALRWLRSVLPIPLRVALLQLHPDDAVRLAEAVREQVQTAFFGGLCCGVVLGLFAAWLAAAVVGA